MNVIAPHEYDLPIKFNPFNALVQYGFYNNDERAYDNGGKGKKGPGTDAYVGLTKYVHFFCLPSLPDYGFALQAILPEIKITGKGVNAGVIGDPIAGFVAWIKPTGYSTLGVQINLQIPIGENEVSNHAWQNLTNFYYGLNLGGFVFDAGVGAVFSSTRDYRGVKTEVGPVFHNNYRLAYRISPWAEPFMSIDYQYATESPVKHTGSRIPASRELALGGGAQLYPWDKLSLAVSYSHSVLGRNVTQTDAVLFKLGYIF